MSAKAKEPANLENSERPRLVGADDEVVDRADPLAFVVRNTPAHEFGGAVALGNGLDINRDQLDGLCRCSWKGPGGTAGAKVNATASVMSGLRMKPPIMGSMNALRTAIIPRAP